MKTWPGNMAISSPPAPRKKKNQKRGDNLYGSLQNLSYYWEVIYSNVWIT